MLEPVKKNRVYEDVSAQIRRQIESGTWKEGMRIQSETELARTLEVSRGSVREAIKSLQLAGLLEARAGHGTFVAPDAVRKIREKKLSEKLRSPAYYDDILEFRHLLEAYSAAQAAVNHTEDDIHRLKQNYEETCRAAGEMNVEEMNRLGNEFHGTLVTMTGNEIINDIYRSIMEPLLEERSEYLADADLEDITVSLSEHAALIEAIEKSDRNQAQEIIDRHLKRKKRNGEKD